MPTTHDVSDLYDEQPPSQWAKDVVEAFREWQRKKKDELLSEYYAKKYPEPAEAVTETGLIISRLGVIEARLTAIESRLAAMERRKLGNWETTVSRPDYSPGSCPPVWTGD